MPMGETELDIIERFTGWELREYHRLYGRGYLTAKQVRELDTGIPMQRTPAQFDDEIRALIAQEEAAEKLVRKAAITRAQRKRAQTMRDQQRKLERRIEAAKRAKRGAA